MVQKIKSEWNKKWKKLRKVYWLMYNDKLLTVIFWPSRQFLNDAKSKWVSGFKSKRKINCLRIRSLCAINNNNIISYRHMLAGPCNMNTSNLPPLDDDNDDVAVYFIVGITFIRGQTELNFKILQYFRCTVYERIIIILSRACVYIIILCCTSNKHSAERAGGRWGTKTTFGRRRILLRRDEKWTKEKILTFLQTIYYKILFADVHTSLYHYYIFVYTTTMMLILLLLYCVPTSSYIQHINIQFFISIFNSNIHFLFCFLFFFKYQIII